MLVIDCGGVTVNTRLGARRVNDTEHAHCQSCPEAGDQSVTSPAVTSGYRRMLQWSYTVCVGNWWMRPLWVLWVLCVKSTTLVRVVARGWNGEIAQFVKALGW